MPRQMTTFRSGHPDMSDIQAQISVLKQTADPAVAEAIQHLIENGEDHQLNRINALDFSKKRR
jgi:Mn-containing catalase